MNMGEQELVTIIANPIGFNFLLNDIINVRLLTKLYFIFF